jgi:uncharacterized membrane protein YphA (DoxX/SURF4 family)
MWIVHRLLRTEAPGSFLLLRLFVGAAYGVDGLRAIRDSVFFGSSSLSGLGLETQTELLLGALEIVCGAFLVLGFLTRLGALLPLLFPARLAWDAYLDLGGFSTASALDALVVNGGVALIALVLLVGGAGAWSVDAAITGEA